MSRFLLINNKPFFDKYNVYTVRDVNDIPDYDSILFIGSHTSSIVIPKIIIPYFEAISKKQHRYIVILGKSDRTVDMDIYIPKNIIYVYANNVNYQHTVVKFLPMGCDFRSISSFSCAGKTKDILCYCNFSLNTHRDRPKIYDMVKNKEFVTIQNMGTFLKYSISRDEFFQNLGRSKFVLCPRGNALDTFRFYDTIYSGAIPIVVKEEFHSSEFFKGVPILYLNHVDEYDSLTEDFLSKKYDEFLLHKKDYYETLDFDVFMEKLVRTLYTI